jgi:hypothetical protein
MMDPKYVGTCQSDVVDRSNRMPNRMPNRMMPLLVAVEQDAAGCRMMDPKEKQYLFGDSKISGLLSSFY